MIAWLCCLISNRFMTLLAQITSLNCKHYTQDSVLCIWSFIRYIAFLAFKTPFTFATLMVHKAFDLSADGLLQTD